MSSSVVFCACYCASVSRRARLCSQLLSLNNPSHRTPTFSSPFLTETNEVSICSSHFRFLHVVYGPESLLSRGWVFSLYMNTHFTWSAFTKDTGLFLFLKVLGTVLMWTWVNRHVFLSPCFVCVSVRVLVCVSEMYLKIIYMTIFYSLTISYTYINKMYFDDIHHPFSLSYFASIPSGTFFFLTTSVF